MLFVILVHMIFVALFFTVPLFCSDPARFNPIYFDEKTIMKMDKLRMSFNEVRDIIHKGNRAATDHPYRFLYTHNGSCAVLDESSVKVINVTKKPWSLSS